MCVSGDKFINCKNLKVELGKISIVDKDGNVVATTDFTDKQKNLEV